MEVDYNKPYCWTTEQREQLLHRARQIRPIRTNPASFRNEELDMPEVGEFHD